MARNNYLLNLHSLDGINVLVTNRKGLQNRGKKWLSLNIISYPYFNKRQYCLVTLTWILVIFTYCKKMNRTKHRLSVNTQTNSCWISVFVSFITMPPKKVTRMSKWSELRQKLPLSISYYIIYNRSSARWSAYWDLVLKWDKTSLILRNGWKWEAFQIQRDNSVPEFLSYNAYVSSIVR